MLYVIGYFLFSFVIIGIVFYIIEHSPSGWEDENGFHASAEPAPQLNNSINQHASNIEIIFGNTVARYRSGN